jgi:hypothetical protein
MNKSSLICQSINLSNKYRVGGHRYLAAAFCVEGGRGAAMESEKKLLLLRLSSRLSMRLDMTMCCRAGVEAAACFGLGFRR